jgi:regulator of protease activity HflC (stomatin/prohibitin superfamily)
MNNRGEVNPIPWIVIALILVLMLIAGGMYGCPQYDVYQSGLAGQAELARAEQNRQIKVNEAKALKDSAQYKADAEVIRAHGVAKANKIIGDSLKDNEAYLRYLYIDMLNETGGDGRETIYIATEAGMPILEAGRFNRDVEVKIGK